MHFTLKFFLLVSVITSGCSQQTIVASSTLTPILPQTPTETALPRLNGHIVYSSNGNIFLFDFQNEKTTPIYHFGEEQPFLGTFVDNEIIYFLSNAQATNSKGTTQLFKMNLDGSEVEQLTFDSENTLDKFDLSGTANGNKLTYIQTSSPYSLIIFNKDTKEINTIIDKDGFDYYLPSWSPDGKMMVFFKADIKERTTSYVTRFGSLMLYSVDTGEIEELLSGEVVPIVKPSWSPDGETIVFNRMAGAEFVSDDICTLNLQSGTVKKLVSGTRNTGHGYFNYYNWSPDGNFILYENLITNQLFVFNFKKSKTIPVSYLDFGLGAHGGLWSPDGRYIAYIIGPNQDLAETNSKRLTILNIQDIETGEIFQYKIPWGRFAETLSWIYP